MPSSFFQGQSAAGEAEYRRVGARGFGWERRERFVTCSRSLCGTHQVDRRQEGSLPLLLSPRGYSCSAASVSCLVLQGKVGTYEEPSRYASDHEIFVRLKHIMITSAFTPHRMLLIGVLLMLSVLFLSCRCLQRRQPPLDCNGRASYHCHLQAC